MSQTLVMWGRQDEILEPELAGRFNREVRNSTVVWVEESGHVPHLEQPAKVAETLIKFAKLRTRSPRSSNSWASNTARSSV